MKKILFRDVKEKIQTLGRTYETETGELFCNWTCSGIRFCFRGSSLAVNINAFPGTEQDRNPMDGTLTDREVWPCIAVFLDDGEEPYQFYELTKAAHTYLLFQGEQEECHTITIRKLTENAKGKVCITAFLTDGEIREPEPQKTRVKLEFIGDSITCGFGNMTEDPNRLFFSGDENGWMSHAAVAARILHGDLSVISCSGIAVTEGIGKFAFPLPPMGHYYPYRDRMAEEMLGKSADFLQWDFQSEKPDVIVLNLGTNDATVIDLNQDTEKGIAKFEEDYYAFLELLRQCNGPEPWILCTLGSMDYFLYDNIQKTAERFREEKKDSKIRCFKYGRIRVDDGLGACRHPNQKTQLRMGEEIADFIQALLTEK
ncbi:MAG: GDSL-type esterase/lipase family protein [Eubacteriales bacterium]|nr:GDSL-type esterase/lipase family protein [Eubacteriales bacterium]